MDLDRPELRLAAALAIGLLVGAERERRKGEGPTRKPAGIRTFVLVALLGAVAASLGDAALVAGVAAIAVFATAAHVFRAREDPGLTTEVALVLTSLLGAYAQRAPQLAVVVGVVTATLLAFRASIHGAVTRFLTTRELLDALIFAVCALVVLPVLPDRPVGPLGGVNSFVLWRLVVLVMGVNALGYAARRFIGPRFGLAIAGFASGFVSSSATIHAMGTRAKESPELERSAVGGAVASSVATFVQLAILVGAASPALLARVAVPLAVGGGVALAYAVVTVWRASRTPSPEEAQGRAFDIKTAVAFALLVTAVMLVTRFVRSRFGEVGTVMASGLAGLADAHASAASAASLFAGGAISERAAAIAVLAALSTNTVTKLVLAFASGTRTYGARVAVGLVAMMATAWAAVFV